MKLRFLPLLFLCSPLTAFSAREEANATMRQQIDILRSINNKEQADAAAALLAGFELPDDADEALYDEYTAACEVLPYHYYGSAALAGAMQVNEEDIPGKVQLPVPATPRIMAELEARARYSFSLLPACIRKGVTGGPGFTQETAWVCTAPRPQDGRDCRSQELFFVPESILGGHDATLVHQEEKEIDGRLYIISTVALFHRGQKHEVTIWEDVTAAPAYNDEEFATYCADTYSANEKDIEVAFAQRQQQRTAILRSVQNKEDADAAADTLADLCSDAHMHDHPEPTLEACEPYINEYMAEEDRLEAARYYGSTLLAQFLNDPLGVYEPQELTPAAAAEIEHIIRAALQASPCVAHRSLTGGPGFTKETAWVIPAEAVRGFDDNIWEHDLTKNIFVPDSRFEFVLDNTDRFGFLNGRLYRSEKVRALLHGKLYHYEMWLDFTDGHVVPTTQEFEAELQQCIANREKKLHVLESVHDKASADAASEFLREWEDAPYPPLMPYGTSDQTSNALFAVDVAFAESEICDNNCYGSSALKILLYTPKGKSDQNMVLTPQEEEAYRQWRFQTTRKSTLRYVQMLQQELPRVHDRTSALALAKKLYRLGGAQVYSHIDLLKPNPYNAPIDTLPIRRQLQRIKNAGYYGAIDLANILKERSGPSGPGYVEQMNDDVEPAESALP
ncbi:MAG: hypothetical protein IKL98_08200 [Akkermansia sp.]|nr:hypothetical protein [Akkermansia sp.]